MGWLRMNRNKASVIAAVVLLLAAGCAVWLYGPKRTAEREAEQTPSPAPTISLVIDPNIGNSPTPPPVEPGVAIPGWGGIKLPSGTTEADVSLYNPKENEGWYYLTFQLKLKETGETLFQTGLIPPGMYCTKVNLLREIEPGVYKGTMHVQPYYMREPPSPTNNADFDITILVT